MTSPSASEGIRRVEMPGTSDLESNYYFSDGAEPPNLVEVWYEGSPDIVSPGSMVALFAQGPFTPSELATHIKGMDDNELSDIAFQMSDAAGRTILTRAELPMDPRLHGEDAAEEAAFKTAEYLFSLAAGQ